MLKKTVTLLLVVFLLPALFIAIIFLTSPVIPLASLSGPISSLLTSLTGQSQQVRGRFFLTPGVWMTLEVDGAEFDVQSGGGVQLEGSIAEARLSLHLWALLSGTLRFDGISLADAAIRLQHSPTSAPQEVLSAGNDDQGVGLEPVLPIETGPISLRNIAVSLQLPIDNYPQLLVIEHAEGEFGRESPGRFQLKADVDGRRFHVEVNTAPLHYLAVDEKVWDFTTRFSHLSSTALVKGAISGTREERLLSAEVAVSGSRLNDVTALFGHQSSENLPFSLRAAVDFSPGHMQARISELQPGSEGLDLLVAVKGSHVRTAEYSLSLKSAVLDLDTLKNLMSLSDHVEPATPGKKISREDKLLPEALPIENLDLILDIETLVIGGRQVSDVRLDAAMKNSRVEQAPFSLNSKHSQISGHCSLDFGGTIPEFSAHYTNASLNVGEMLEELGLLEAADDVSMLVASVETELHSRGITAGELLDNLSLSILAREGIYRYRDPNTGADLVIELPESHISLNLGEDFSLNLDGRIGEVPVSIDLVALADQQGRTAGGREILSLKIEVRAAGAVWALHGNFPLPVDLNEGSLQFQLRGELFSDLNELLKVELPPVGPYELTGTFERSRNGYHLDNLNVLVGTSLLNGSIFVDTKVSPPKVRVELSSPSIQLNDFRMLSEVLPAETAGQPTEIFKTKEPPAAKQKYLSDQSVLESYDATIQIEVKEVLSGDDFLGGGSARIEQKQGSLRMSPLTLHLPGGTVAVDFSLEPSAGNRLYQLEILVEDFDYGILSRYFQPDTDMSGILDLQTSLTGISPDFKSLMANSNGNLNFSVRPEKWRSGVVDLWAVNFFSYLGSFLTSGSESRVNCYAGRFLINQGILHQDKLLIDTSRIQVKGDVEIDFNKQYINAYLRPIPKRPQFFSLATPIKISGSYQNVGISLPAVGIIGTIVRLATSYIVVPIQWIILNKLPEDGTAACLEMIESREQEPQQ